MVVNYNVSPSCHSRIKSVSTSDSNSHKKIRSTLFEMLLIYFLSRHFNDILFIIICVVDTSLQTVNFQFSVFNYLYIGPKLAQAL